MNKANKGRVYTQSLLTLLGIVCIASEAYAGFEWNPATSGVSVTPSIEASEGSSVLLPTSKASGVDVSSDELLSTKSNSKEKPVNLGNSPYSYGSSGGEEQVYYNGKPLRRHKPEASSVAKIQEVTSENLSVPPSGTFIEAPAPDNDIRLTLPKKAVMKPQAAPVTYSDPQPYAPVKKQTSYKKPKPVVSYSNAVGFGKDMPLALVLGQIIPHGYSYSFAKGVNPGAQVSWQGGRPWDQVLSSALAPHGLDIIIIGKKVTIFFADSKTRDFGDRAGNNSEVSVSVAVKDVPEEGNIIVDVQEINAQPLITEEPVAYVEVDVTEVNPVPEPVHKIDPANNQKTADKPLIEGAAAMELAMKEDIESKPEQSLSEEDLSEAEPVQMLEAGITVEQEISPAVGNAPDLAVENKAGKYLEAAVASFDPSSVDLWSARGGDTLRSTLIDWSGRAGVRLHWASKYDYPLNTDIMVDGTYEEAVEMLLTSLIESDPSPIARLQPDEKDGAAVLIVETVRMVN